MSVKAIIIGGRSIRYEIEDVDIFSIDYYEENPRINYLISKYPPDQVNSSLIEKTLLSRDSTKDLIHSIEENGGLYEPILVYNGRVIEGNTRLCAYRRLYHKTKDNYWKLIKAHVILEELTAKEIFNILSNYHIKGKTPWDPYEKAACINKMIEQGQSVEDVAKAVGMSKNKVENQLKAYKVMRDKYLKKFEKDTGQISGGLEELKKFSYFEAFYINTNLAKRASQTPEFVDQFVEWVAEGRIPKAQDVRELGNILDNKKASKSLLNSEAENAFADAKDSLRWYKPDKIDGFYKRVNDFRELVRMQNVSKIKDEIQNNPNMRSVIKYCLKDLQKFCKDINLD